MEENLYTIHEKTAAVLLSPGLVGPVKSDHERLSKLKPVFKKDQKGISKVKVLDSEGVVLREKDLEDFRELEPGTWANFINSETFVVYIVRCIRPGDMDKVTLLKDKIKQ